MPVPMPTERISLNEACKRIVAAVPNLESAQITSTAIEFRFKQPVEQILFKGNGDVKRMVKGYIVALPSDDTVSVDDCDDLAKLIQRFIDTGREDYTPMTTMHLRENPDEVTDLSHIPPLKSGETLTLPHDSDSPTG